MYIYIYICIYIHIYTCIISLLYRLLLRRDSPSPKSKIQLLTHTFVRCRRNQSYK